MSAPAAKVANILVVYYSMYGHIATLADSIVAGIKATGANVTVRQIPETLSAEILGKMHAPPKRDIPVVTHDDLVAADGIFFGLPTRYGMAPAQVKAFIDSTGQLWAKGALVGKMAAVFFSTATQNGGQETTALTFITQLVHHGMVFVPLGYTNPLLFDLTEVHGGSPYGAGTLAGSDGSRQPSKNELAVGESHGKHFATIVNQYVAGKAAAAPAQ